MKQFLYLFTLLLLLLPSCDNVSENTTYSKIIGNWKLTKYFANNIDATSSYLSAYPNYQMNFANNGSVKASYTDTATNQLTFALGFYELKENNTIVEITFNGIPIQTAKILQLNNETFHHVYVAGGDSIERHFERIQ